MDAHAAHSAVTAAAPVFSSRPEDLAWFILLLPLIAAIGVAVGVRKDNLLSAAFSIAAVSVSFLLSVALFLTFGLGGHAAVTAFGEKGFVAHLRKGIV